MREEGRERDMTGFDLEAAEARSRNGGDWVTVGCLSCGGLLDMGREKKGRSVTTAHPLCDGHSTSTSVYRVWGVRVRV